MTWARRVSLYCLATVMLVAGTLHFASPEPYVQIVPDYLPAPRMLVYVSGVAELAGGLGLLLRRTRQIAAWGVIALLVAVFPANVHMAVHEITPAGMSPIPTWALWARLPLQAALIHWAYSFTRPLRSPA